MTVDGLTGLGAISIGAFAIGCFNFSSTWLQPALGIMALVGVFRLRAHLPKVWKLADDWRLLAPPLAIASFVVLLLAVAGLTEPAGTIAHDGIYYHLLGPVVWVRTGIIKPLADCFPTAYPSLVETLFAFCLILKSKIAPSLIGVIFFVALLVLVWSCCRVLEAGRQTSAWVVAAVALAPLVNCTVIEYFVDVPLTVFALAALRFAIAGPSAIVATAVMCGFAMSTKYTGSITTAVTLISMLVFLGKSPGLLIGRFLPVVCFVGCPWYLRNWIELGVPIYPPPGVVQRLFMSASAVPAGYFDEFFRFSAIKGGGMGGGFGNLILLPYQFTYFTDNFAGAGGFGLVPLAFGPIGIWQSRQRPEVKFFVLWATLLTLIWFVSDREARYLIPGVIVLFVLASKGLQYCFASVKRQTRVLAWSVLLIPMIYGLAYLISVDSPRVLALLSAEQRATYFEKNVLGADLFAYINSSDEVRSVLVTAPRSNSWPTFVAYYLDKPYVRVRGELFGELPLLPIRTNEEALKHVKQLGVTHVITEKNLDVSSYPLHLVFQTPIGRIYQVNKDDVKVEHATKSQLDERSEP